MTVWIDDFFPWRRDRLEARAARDESIAALAAARANRDHDRKLHAVIVEIRKRNNLVAGMLDVLGARKDTDR